MTEPPAPTAPTEAPMPEASVTPIREGNGAKQAAIPVPAERIAGVREARDETLALETRIGAHRIEYLARERQFVEAHAKAMDLFRLADRRLRNGCDAPPEWVLDLVAGCFRPRRSGE